MIPPLNIPGSIKIKIFFNPGLLKFNLNLGISLSFIIGIKLMSNWSIPAMNTPHAIAKTGSWKYSVKKVAPTIMLKLKAIGVAAGIENILKEFKTDPKKATIEIKKR